MPSRFILGGVSTSHVEAAAWSAAASLGEQQCRLVGSSTACDYPGVVLVLLPNGDLYCTTDPSSMFWQLNLVVGT